jgi:TatD DNase family protein
MWIDTHAHLFEYPVNQLQGILSDAEEANVSTIISTATDLQNAALVVDHCHYAPAIYGAAGISPFDVLSLPEDWKTILEEILKNPGIIAVGEIGIDSTNPRYPSLESQIPVFEAQLDIAHKLNMPAVIHSRGVEVRAVEICRNIGIQHAIFHCFTGDYQAMKKITDAGYFISFSGIITFKKAEIRQLIPSVPIEHLMIETDSPYLAPVPFRGEKNRPALVKFVGEEIARLINMDSDNLQIQLESNIRILISI